MGRHRARHGAHLEARQWAAPTGATPGHAYSHDGCSPTHCLPTPRDVQVARRPNGAIAGGPAHGFARGPAGSPARRRRDASSRGVRLRPLPPGSWPGPTTWGGGCQGPRAPHFVTWGRRPASLCLSSTRGWTWQRGGRPRLAAAARVDLTILVVERGGCWRRRPSLGLQRPQGEVSIESSGGQTRWLGCDYLTPLVAGNA